MADKGGRESDTDASPEGTVDQEGKPKKKTASRERPARSLKDRAEAYKKKEEALRKQRLAIERRVRGQDRSQQRKDAIRQKLLIGTWFLDEVGEHQSRKDYLVKLIERRTTARDHEVMKDLYKDLTGKDLTLPVVPDETDPS
ncbi:hypothetical protein [Microvirga arabica]|uniref:hypothetical protein n=1 Tax=Microvirga arabica TaxID=1128671 RepID=UPI001939803C|nr:hypothetical protein [Microvirga arabica]MBM1173491.1 hypothetical protein [Microvirga arabica]